MGGMTGKGLTPRVHDDELGTCLGRVLEERRRDRVIDGRIRPDDDDDVRVRGLCERCCDRARADAFQQGCNRGGMAQARAVVDVVRAETDADQFLDQIGFFVRTLGGPEPGQRPASVLVLDFLET